MKTPSVIWGTDPRTWDELSPEEQDLVRRHVEWIQSQFDVSDIIVSEPGATSESDT